MFDTPIQTTLGLSPTTLDVTITMRNAAAVVGEVVKFDLGASDDLVTTNDVGSSAGVFANCIEASHPATAGTVHGVCLEAIAENATGKVRVRGIVDALGGDTTARGGVLTVDGNGNLEIANTASDLVIAVALEALEDGVLKSVLFDGTGMGTV
ncbi:MAG: hypothetical protein GOVbin2833_41 [Prokaryotic dsDNA virus sp.]|nr:MAG: hypothetical protein GOVbin2833_41 [Prokaryotic dsDNA virus sp.]|tara:strand:+ start:265 stop:723 length:459 start_codon:yes stop_codon:yes gene_type:complete